MPENLNDPGPRGQEKMRPVSEDVLEEEAERAEKERDAERTYVRARTALEDQDGQL